jgi:hypothetical protein
MVIWCCQPQWNILQSSHTVHNIFCPIIIQIWIFVPDYHRNIQYEISRECLWWELRWYMQTDGWADRCDEANRHCPKPCKRTYNSLLFTLSVYILVLWTMNTKQLQSNSISEYSWCESLNFYRVLTLWPCKYTYRAVCWACQRIC